MTDIILYFTIKNIKIVIEDLEIIKKTLKNKRKLKL